ncbi:hypothetical protein ACFPM0_34450 [Pseudonocardia sulfidoxydans]
MPSPEGTAAVSNLGVCTRRHRAWIKGRYPTAIAVPTGTERSPDRRPWMAVWAGTRGRNSAQRPNGRRGLRMGHDAVMVVRIAGLPVLGPSDVLAGARAVAGWTEDAVGMAGELPGRAGRLLDGAEALVERISGIADRVDGLLDRVDGSVAAVDALLTEVGGVVARTSTVVGTAEKLVATVGGVAGEAETIVRTAGAVATQAATVVGAAQGVAQQAGEVVDGAGVVARRAGEVVGSAGSTSDAAAALLATWGPVSQRAAPLARTFVEQFSEDEVRAAVRLVDHLPQLTEHLENDIMPILTTLDRVGPDVHELLDVLKEVRQAILGIPGFAFFRRRGEEKTDQES